MAKRSVIEEINASIESMKWSKADDERIAIETRGAKVSEQLRGRKTGKVISESNRLKLSAAAKKCKSAETRRKIAKARTGQTWTEGRKKARSKAIQERGLTERQLTALREGKIKRNNPVSIAKVAAWHTGKKRPEETKIRLKEAWKKRVVPEKTCPHCGLTAKAYPNLYRYHFDNCKYKN